jgi:hypothetical protein
MKQARAVRAGSFVNAVRDRAAGVAVLRACGHVPFFEVPDTFATVVRTFVRTC